ncbi:MAG: septation protein A [Gammaproteobacteria bacterium]|nr:septation protein A [Gammaproteobacteria bacterium]
MKLLFDFLPIVAFFVCYKFFGIFVATAIAMIIVSAQVLLFWLQHRRFELTQIITLVLILIFGGATLFSHNEMFIKWKPTALYWIFAIVFIASNLIGKKPVIEHLMGGKISLPKNVWSRLNISWAIFFSMMGIINIYVAYKFNTNTWVNFKLFGILGGTLLFGILQSVYITKFLQTEPETK